MLKKLEDYQLFLEVDLGSYESEAIMQASYKFTDECYVYINPISENTVGVYFKIKKGDVTELEKFMDRFRNELIDQQTRIIVERNFSSIRDEIVKKAFSSIS
ncbi:MAG: His-Xaa-Ser system protein HxsD [Gammaproteobacteria bacterium RBG_16_37_9]|nr:MAG: His-Xaa-Ser system protein HxsD [Gammaproteobacteria bacterium RBG_16_37_9]